MLTGGPLLCRRPGAGSGPPGRQPDTASLVPFLPGMEEGGAAAEEEAIGTCLASAPENGEENALWPVGAARVWSPGERAKGPLLT